MDPEDPGRRVVAVMAIGVPDGGARMAQDAAAALSGFAALRRRVIDPLLASHRGRCFNAVAFRLLVEFPCAELALHCAARLQRLAAAPDPGLSAGERLALAISLHEGEVVERDRELFGEAVQVAVGLQTLAGPGEIWMSGGVARQAREVLRLPLEEFEPLELRGVAHAMPAARVAGGALLPGHARATLPAGIVLHPSQLRNDAARDPPVPPEPAHHLLLPGRAGAPRSIGIPARPLVVGRLPSCDLPLSGMEVSRRHCSFELVQGRVVMTDLGSTNGTFVDGVRVQGPTLLRDGAEIRVGSHTLRYMRTSYIDEEPTYVGGLSDWLAGPAK
jgi:class 3 adenylate cyclase